MTLGRALPVFLSLSLAAACSSSGPDSGSRSPGRGTPAASRFVTDSRGVSVEIPRNPRRVATISDALVEEVMTVFGVQDRLVGIGSTCLVREFHYEFTAADGSTFSHRGGMNPARYLNPELADLPLFVRPGTEISYETLAGLNPDLLIIDAGSCTLPWRSDRQAVVQGLNRLEALRIPTLVLTGPNARGDRDIESLSQVIRILGEVFDSQDQAERLADYLEESVQLVEERTRRISESDRRSVLLLGLNPDLRGEGAVGQSYGSSDIQSYFVEALVHARSAYTGRASAVLNLEQILALDPDVIILPTANGYHPPRELYELEYFRNLRHLKAVRNRRVGALPWSPCNCDKRLEYPIDVFVIATTTYPELFPDLELSDWLIRFYQEVYQVDEVTAQGLLRAQWMDWTLDG